MLPPFDPASGNLPPGVHEAAWEEIAERFGWNEQRQALIVGLRAALEALRDAGCEWVYIDGSFVSAKEHPNDFDACWEQAGVDDDLLDPVFFDFSRSRAAQKARFGGELFPAEYPADIFGTSFFEFFQRSRTLERKGIVAVDLGALDDS